MGGLTVITRDHAMPGLIADRRLCLLADHVTLVEGNDPAAAFVLASRAGKAIPAHEVARLGLSVVDGRVVQASAAGPPPAVESEIRVAQDPAPPAPES